MTDFSTEDIDRIIEEIRLDFENGNDPFSTFSDDDGLSPDAWGNNAPWHWVTPQIAVGGDDYLGDSELSDRMEAEGVTHVIDCRAEADQDEFWFPKQSVALVKRTKKRFVYLLNGTGDDGKPKSAAYFRPAIEFALDALRDPDAKIYVHCAAGYNRGPSVAFAIMRALGWTDGNAEAAIRKVRSVGLLYQQDANRAIRALGYGPKRRRRRGGKR